jgi:hypothetical protein
MLPVKLAREYFFLLNGAFTNDVFKQLLELIAINAAILVIIA